MSAARKRAPTSLNAAVGPWKSSSTASSPLPDERLQRQREIERIAANGAELALEPRAFEERREHLGRDLRQRLAAHGAGIEARQLVGHEQAAVRGEAAHHRVDETRFLPRRAC